MSMTTNAQTITGDFYFENSRGALCSVPREFSYNDIPRLFLYDRNDNSSLCVYDENLDLLKTINLKKMPFDYQLTYQKEEREVKSVDEISKSGSKTWESYDAFIQYQKDVSYNFDESCLIIRNLENGDKKITFDYSKLPELEGSIENQYYDYEYFGTQYPYFYLIEHEGKVTLYRAYYAITYTDWVDKGTSVTNCTKDLPPIRLYNLNLNNDAYQASKYFEVSQTLFNNDEKFEYLVPKLKLVEHGNAGSAIDNNYDVAYPEKVETSRNSLVSQETEFDLVGFQVVSEDGSVLKDLSINHFDGRITYSIAYVITIGENTYLAFNGNDSEGKSSTIFYRIDRTTTNIQKVENVPAVLKVFPTIVEKGSTINVDLGSQVDTDSEITVYSASGAKVKSVQVPAGQRNAQFNLYAPSGLYCVSRLQNGKRNSAQKVIIK